MARFYGPIQQNPGGGEIIEIEPTSLPTDAVILTNPVDGKNNQEDANQYFYEELQNKADAGHTHGTDGDGNEIDTSNLVTKTEFSDSQDSQDERISALEAGEGTGSGPHTHDEYADKDHVHDAPDLTHDHDGTYQPAGNYATNEELTQGLAGKANVAHTHDGVGGETYDDTELRGLIADNTTAIEGKADDPHTHEDLVYDDTALAASVSSNTVKNSEQDGRLDALEAAPGYDDTALAARVFTNENEIDVLQGNEADQNVSIQANTDALADKADATHTHPEYEGGSGESYDDTEVRNLIQGNTDALANKSDTGHIHDSAPHTHTEYSPTDHTHDEYLDSLPTHDHPHTHDEYGSADDVTALWVLANSNEAKANDNTVKNSEQDDRLDALESSNQQGDSTIFYQNTNSNIYQDGVPGNPSPQGWQGWHYASAGDGTKINWYFYAQDFSNPEVFAGELNSFALIVVPETRDTRLPHVNVYTMPQGDGQDAKVWYRSRATYENTGRSWTANQPYVVYYGQDPEIFENYPRIELAKADYTSEGPQQDDEGIFLLAISSDSSASADDYNFTLQQSHIDSVDYIQNAVFLAPTSVESYLAEGGTTYASALAIEEDISSIETELESIRGRPKPKTDEIPLSDDDEGIFFGDDVVHTQHDVNETIHNRLLGEDARLDALQESQEEQNTRLDALEEGMGGDDCILGRYIRNDFFYHNGGAQAQDYYLKLHKPTNNYGDDGNQGDLDNRDINKNMSEIEVGDTIWLIVGDNVHEIVLDAKQDLSYYYGYRFKERVESLIPKDAEFLLQSAETCEGGDTSDDHDHEGMVVSDSVTSIVKISQADFNALADKDASTLYLVV